MKHVDGQPHFPPLSIQFMHFAEGAKKTSTMMMIVILIINYRESRGNVVS
jgi:hypothetical protein